MPIRFGGNRVGRSVAFSVRLRLIQRRQPTRAVTAGSGGLLRVGSVWDGPG